MANSKQNPEKVHKKNIVWKFRVVHSSSNQASNGYGIKVDTRLDGLLRHKVLRSMLPGDIGAAHLAILNRTLLSLKT